jgi:hypothetical protein
MFGFVGCSHLELVPDIFGRDRRLRDSEPPKGVRSGSTTRHVATALACPNERTSPDGAAESVWCQKPKCSSLDDRVCAPRRFAVTPCHGFAGCAVFGWWSCRYEAKWSRIITSPATAVSKRPSCTSRGNSDHNASAALPSKRSNS